MEEQHQSSGETVFSGLFWRIVLLGCVCFLVGYLWTFLQPSDMVVVTVCLIGLFSFSAFSLYREHQILVRSLGEREESMRALFENHRDLICRVSSDSRVLFANRALLNWLGKGLNEVQGKFLDEVGFLPETVLRLREGMKAVFRGGQPACLEVSRPTPQGHRFFQVRIFPECDSEGKVLSFLGVAQDITDRQAGEMALQRTVQTLARRETELLSLLGAAREVVEARDFQKTARQMFDTCRQLIGARIGFVALTSSDNQVDEIIHIEMPGGPSSIRLPLRVPISGLREKAYRERKVILQNDFPNCEWQQEMPLNHLALENILLAPLLDGDKMVGLLALANKPGNFDSHDERLVEAFGEFISIALREARYQELRGVSEDIRRHAEETVQRSEERLRLALEATSDGMWDWNIVTGETYFSPRYYTMLGYQPNEFPGSYDSWKNLLAPEERDEVIRRVTMALEKTPERYKHEFRCRTKSGKYKWIQARGKVVEWTADGKPRRLIGVHTDVTDKKEQEQESHLLFTALEQAPVSFIITDAAGDIEYVNSSFIKMTGYSRPEILGRNPRLLKSGRHEAAFYQAMWEKLLSGNIWRGVLVNKRKDGSLYEEEKTIAPVRDVEGHPTHFVSASRDVTRERLIESQFQQTQKMQALGTLAGGIAHDFNNILMALQGYAELGLEEAGDNVAVKRCIDQIVSGANRAGKLVEQILTFSRQRETSIQAIDPAPIFMETIKFLRGSVPTSIQIKTELDAECGPILADPTQIHQLIMNLGSNAQYAMREKGGTLTVRMKRVPRVPDHSCHSNNAWEVPEGFVCIEVEDTGTGMAPDVAAHVFEPFFTTKPQGEGTGMGLSTVQGIVYGAGGHIVFKSEPGRGTLFSLYLPRVKAEVLHPVKDSREVVGGSERVLLVDDEEHLIDLLKSMLEKWGYQVTTCYNGQEALLRFEADQGAYDLLLTDQTMPGMPGTELVRRLLNLKPELVVVAMTGFSEQLTPESAKEVGIARLIHKPIIGARLAEAIRSAIDEQKRKNSRAKNSDC